MVWWLSSVSLLLLARNKGQRKVEVSEVRARGGSEMVGERRVWANWGPEIIENNASALNTALSE